MRDKENKLLREKGVRVYIKVSPRSSKNEVYPVKSSLLRGAELFNGVVKIKYGEYKVKLTAPPIDNKANNMLIRVMADHLNLPKSSLKIIGGKTAITKIIEIL
ncbi:hypothetical protein BMS3Abin15_00718 [bacterium BMS3Abin15]|nr:hypothetical protein BMS3Abin15_00718 [bacterium BMS3Abin15]HDH07797.1 DUF167 domain-containing protein [Candidatus Moranbacteria bacterium]HDZ85937.1 DUF167 domain-containing protein [Candidatus Moranbacteria bacterium]